MNDIINKSIDIVGPNYSTLLNEKTATIGTTTSRDGSTIGDLQQVAEAYKQHFIQNNFSSSHFLDSNRNSLALAKGFKTNPELF